MPIRKEWKRSRRGLGNVVTTMILVVAVSVMGAALVLWSNSNFAIQRLNIANATDNRVNLIRESFIIEDVWFFEKLGVNYANVTIRNTGDTAIKISHIYINNTQVWNAGKIIAKGDVAELDVASNWGSGKPQSIWVKTDRGTHVKQVWKA